MVKGAKTIEQFIILQWITANFIDVTTELIERDKVRLTDCTGESVDLTINSNREIMDADTKEILSR